MSNRFYYTVLTIITASLAVIYYYLNHNVGHPNWPSPIPGRPLSLVLGWSGLILMIMTNLYIIRKRFKVFHKWGVLTNWLNFHIFLGLMGPVCILFHSNFKVRGLVAISFWSMIVSASSGVVGRYFYVQISKLKADFLREAENINKELLKLIALKNVPEVEFFSARKDILIMAGADHYSANPFGAFVKSFVGDLNLTFKHIPSPPALEHEGAELLKDYAVTTRKANTVDSFNKLMGYWHTFHMPFAFFMYLTAIFHVIAALVFGVTTPP